MASNQDEMMDVTQSPVEITEEPMEVAQPSYDEVEPMEATQSFLDQSEEPMEVVSQPTPITQSEAVQTADEQSIAVAILFSRASAAFLLLRQVADLLALLQ